MPQPDPFSLRALDFVEQVMVLDTADAVLNCFRSSAGELGFSTVVAGQTPIAGAPNLPPFFISTWSEDLIQTYEAEGLMRDDPSVEAAHAHTLPVLWSDIHARRRSEGRSLKAFDLAVAFGFPQGLVIPVHGSGRTLGLVTIAGETPDLSADNRAALHMMGLWLYDRLQAIVLPERTAVADPKLSAGELECIKWLLAGKTDWEIGEILGIAEATAHWRVEQAKRKLGVKTRAQLTAVAVARGYVRI